MDNSAVNLKANMRILNLPNRPVVLDLFCGTGEMYKKVYQDRAIFYHGVDKEKIHDPDICTKEDNLRFFAREGIDQFNVFDLDDYGSPWKQLYLILQKLNRPDVTIFITDGLVLHQKVDGNVTRFVSATEQIRRDANIPGLCRWYVDIFATMLLDLQKRYIWKIIEAKYFHNSRETVYYWCLKLKK